MIDISIPILKINNLAKDPEKVNNNTFKFFSDQNYYILQEMPNLISSGFYLKNILFKIYPSDIYYNINCISSPFVSEDSLISINSYSYEKLIKNKYSDPFAQKRKIIEKNTCILYLSIISSEYEKNYIFDIIT
jgi:hypothetical protein